MSNNNTSIHDFDFSFICNYFKLLKRQGPGSPEATRKAVSFINELTDDAKIADIGCGTGGQTLFLADYVKGQITGIDLFPDFIEIFNENAVKANCADRVKGINGQSPVSERGTRPDLVGRSNLQYRIRTWDERMEQIPEKRRFYRSERSILVHFGTPCGNRRLLDGRLSGNQRDPDMY